MEKSRLNLAKIKPYLLLTICMVFFAGTTLHAQFPDKFYNLKVLPKHISKEKLHQIMDNFTSGLGVNCGFCHAKDQSAPGDKLDFTKDTKPAKKKARVMMKMVENINGNYMQKIADLSEDHDAEHVQCVTCHHGQKVPRTLEQVLTYTIDKDGVDAAVKKYHELYDKYYGGFQFDFKDHSLTRLTEDLIKANKPDAALAMSKLNSEMYPKSGVAFYGLAMAYEAKGDKQQALENYKKVLEQFPNNRRIMEKINELQKQ